MISTHLRAGDVAVLALIIGALAVPVYLVLLLALRPAPRSATGKLSRRVATGAVVRRTAGAVARLGRFDRWN